MWDGQTWTDERRPAPAFDAPTGPLPVTRSEAPRIVSLLRVVTVSVVVVAAVVLAIALARSRSSSGPGTAGLATR